MLSRDFTCEIQKSSQHFPGISHCFLVALSLCSLGVSPADFLELSSLHSWDLSVLFSTFRIPGERTSLGFLQFLLVIIGSTGFLRTRNYFQGTFKIQNLSYLLELPRNSTNNSICRISQHLASNI